jgi:hypothetical protein
MRNVGFTLDTVQAARVGGYVQSLRRHMASGHIVTIEFTKRDGTERTIRGAIESLKGEGSHSVVVIAMADGTGYRSANVYDMHSLKGE